MAEEPTTQKWSGEQHLELLTTLHWVATGILGLIFLFTSLAIGVDFPFIFIFIVPLIGLHAAAAMGLMQRDNWGRIVSMIAAILFLFSFPFGTAFGVYALIIHNRPDVKELLQGEHQ